ncbi:FACT complex subunit SSRP1, partial [Galendromus occidentalis]|uniref:FACT complex subunit SSRP1 n=1 Tax=Galendromus occidentalis TaxID=34638 RepID=A0AAJ6VW41_9ACAR
MVNSIFEYGDVWKEDRGAMAPGKLKLTDQNIVFKNAKTGKVDQINNGEVESVFWQRLAGAYGLRIQTKNPSLYRFGGFQNDERGKLREFFKEFYNLDMKTKEFSLTGRNWGTVNFDPVVLSFDIDKVPAFEIPLAYVSNCSTSKNEVTLEFQPNDDAPSCMMEMRFYVPTDPNPDVDAVEAFKANVMSRAGITQATGDAIANFNGVQCLTPRGRYDIKIFTTFI